MFPVKRKKKAKQYQQQQQQQQQQQKTGLFIVIDLPSCTLLSDCGTPIYQFSSANTLFYVSSIRNNCFEFHTANGVIFAIC